MANWDTAAAWHYHNGTKHPHGYLMNPGHRFNPMQHPVLFKTYSDLEAIPLSVDTSPRSVPALSAIASDAVHAGDRRIPDVGALARILYFSAGVTKKIAYQWADMSFRAAACTGALYHIELYVVCGDIPGLAAGVYHFDSREQALRQLRNGDYRQVLTEAAGGESGIANAPATIAYTDVFWRNACKYQAREYRHTFWDCGTVLANTLAIAAADRIPAKVVVGFVDESVNQLLDLDTRREVAVALLPVGEAAGTITEDSPEVRPMSLRTASISDHELDFPAIWEVHAASSLPTAEEVASWRSGTRPATTSEPSGRLFQLEPSTAEEMSQDSIEAVIIRRGSSRRFTHDSITFQQLSTALDRAIRGIPADFSPPPGVKLNDLYLIVNAVDGLPPGAYAFHPDRRALELLVEGDFRQEAGDLGLHQDLPADASVNVYFLSELVPILDQFGNRGYRAAQLEAAIMAGKLYLAAYAQRFGATGLTFYDDAVIDYFSPHAQDKSVMFLIALGKRARRR